MKSCIYEMHQHTFPCSHCGRGDPEKTVYALKEAGFSGMVLTNHFFNGNTGIDRALPWEQFVSRYEEDYLKAKKAGEKADFDVIFGIEEHIGKGKELLLYGITPEFLYERPFMNCGELEIISDAVREYGALVFQAHPYRSRSYVTDPYENLPLKYLYGFETFNAANPENENLMAAEYAVRNNLLCCAGSDAHTEVVPVRYGIKTAGRITSSKELARVLGQGDYELYPEDKLC